MYEWGHPMSTYAYLRLIVNFLWHPMTVQSNDLFCRSHIPKSCRVALLMLTISIRAVNLRRWVYSSWMGNFIRITSSAAACVSEVKDLFPAEGRSPFEPRGFPEGMKSLGRRRCRRCRCMHICRKRKRMIRPSWSPMFRDCCRPRGHHLFSRLFIQMC